MWFNIDWDIFIFQYLPTFLRKPVWIGILRAVFAPVKVIYEQWRLFRSDNIYLLTHTGQVSVLRYALNDHFDPYARRIQILDGYRFNRSYIYTHAENRPIWLGTLFIRQASDYADTGVDFIVIAPQNLQSQEFAIKDFVNTYKEASKRFKIIWQ